jgi:hypothetical protein
VKEKGNALIIGIVIGLVTAALLVGVFLLFNYKNVETPHAYPPLNSSSSPVSTSTPTSDPTLNWKLYENQSLGFSIKYPSDKLFRYNCPDEGLVLVKRTADLGPADEMGLTTCGRDGRFPIEVQLMTTPVQEPVTSHDYTVLTDSIMIANLNAKRFTVTMNPNCQGMCTTTWAQEIFLNTQGKYYGFFLTDQTLQTIFNQMLTTFKLISVSKVPADAQTPTAGACGGPTADQIVEVSFAPDNVPNPRCTKVTASQKLKIINNSGHAISGTVGSYTINIADGKSQTLDSNFGSYLMPGVHKIVGAEIWLQ